MKSLIKVLGERRRSLAAVYLTVLAMSVVAAASMAQTTSTTGGPTLPDVTVFNSTVGQVQTLLVNLVTGPGQYAIYAMLVVASFYFVWHLIGRAIHSR